ncbi:hypothetical protein PtA15_17A313 [Puccinia triticina]|uniref:Uncharacterized protein n=1 Tax=Puccinia triticina TaxID=208348 RepID=A0ABY7D918_9BASI|nr:uncharacterized protein PtA15_17A313 [Puccinia triticina]WAQ92831.1 hypothetical protein PtA15_17A313 [Puccinia triticina]
MEERRRAIAASTTQQAGPRGPGSSVTRSRPQLQDSSEYQQRFDENEDTSEDESSDNCLDRDTLPTQTQNFGPNDLLPLDPLLS